MWFYPTLNPALMILERIGLIRPNLVAIVDHSVQWPTEDPNDAKDFATYEEELSFFLFQYPSGLRSYKLHQYGRCEIVKYHEVFLRDVLAWTYGGALPKGAVRTQQPAEVVPLRVVKVIPA